ncbi:MAG: hypothetical protein FWD81_03220, partial [Methanomassiliicoccaceae archaeon]|nr:hypothetical protein [Methanomassiliicoccaceae archaeon]
MLAAYDITANFNGDDYFELKVTVSDPSTAADGIVQVYVNDDLVTTVAAGETFEMNVTDGWSVKLVAIEDESVFSNWVSNATLPSDMTDATAQSQIFAMEGDHDLTAVFAQASDMYTLDLSASGPGTISVTIGGITNTGVTSFSARLAYGTAVELEAVPDLNGVFYSWYGALAGNEVERTLTVSENTFVGAIFYHEDDPVYTLTAYAVGNTSGTVWWSVDGIAWEVLVSLVTPPGTYDVASVVLTIPQSQTSIELWADTDELFYSWYGALAGDDPLMTLTFSAGTDTYMVGAIFHIHDDPFVYYSVIGDGKIQWSIDGISWADLDLTKSPLWVPPFETSVWLRAVANTGSSFFSWMGDLAGGIAEVELMMDGTDKTVVAVFYYDTETMYTLTSDTIGDGKIQWSLDGKTWADLPATLGIPESIGSIQLMAVPNVGYGFAYWFGDLFGNDPLQTIVMNSDKDITAAFYNELLRDQHTLSLGDIIGDGTIWWSVRGSGYSLLTVNGVVFLPGDVVSLRTEAGAGYYFLQWTGDHYGNEHPTSLTMVSPMTVGAKFVTTEGSSPFLFVLPVLILFILLGMGYWWWFAAMSRSAFSVTMIHAHNATIYGRNKAFRETAYKFRSSGTGKMKYRVGDEGGWKFIESNWRGEYTIPKEDVTGNLTIEQE